MGDPPHRWPMNMSFLLHSRNIIRKDISDLIDQIVYKLYGLTEEEIAIVEGRAD